MPARRDPSRLSRVREHVQRPGQRLAAGRALVGVMVAVLLLLCASVARAADEESTRIGGIAVVVWSKPGVTPQAQPVIVFSHAMYMCPTQSRYLMRALADAGYLVIAPRHADSNCDLSIDFTDLSRYALKPSLLWSDSDYRDRGDDIRRLVAALFRDPRFAHRADPVRLALAGHSLGGYTVLGLGGAWPSWKLPGVRAILALTPYALPFQHSEGLRKLAAPVMYQVGTLDPMFTLPLGLSGYDQSPAPKYYVEFATAAHLAWTDLGMGGRDPIIEYALAFFDHYVKDAPARPVLQTKLPEVAKFAHAER